MKPENTGVGSLSLLQQIFLTQELSWGLQHFRQILYQLSYQESHKEMGIPDHLTYVLRNHMQVKKQQLEPYKKQLTGSKLGQEYSKTVSCSPVYLASMQSTL